ncbi:STAS-like domain-containing protein [Pseudoalteromonas sp. SG44-5]|uniref:STAS-like domain-containing protein n=1 Tax=Pseudoalteromonas sp. SG44-5 TaxID=2760960 RepID=UPI0015FDDEF6|nr:STAS-like domain-containing protein [Pseudoalteromonas sp. SG44-5]MBB1406646.1 STAS-like domain-containing protein [Pseudoalteromonas sp. SG44-5]
MNKVIIFLKNFSKSPFGRYKTDSNYSGEVFRDNILVPALKNNDIVEVDLNNLDVELGSSFLEETFGGLLRTHIFSKADLEQRLIITSGDSYDKERVMKYIDKAAISTQGFAARSHR